MHQGARAKQASLGNGRLYGALAYGAILLTCIAGLLHVSWWAMCAGAALLALLSVADPQGSHAYFQRVGIRMAPAATLASSALNAAVAASAAYLLGRLIAWFWGL
jgi:hypothetical protein